MLLKAMLLWVGLKRKVDVLTRSAMRTSACLAAKGVDADSKENMGQMPLFVRGSERVHGWTASIGLISVLDIAPCGALEDHPD
jgi:hypothetical protein